jgi:probable rRNA maturation factor
MPGPRAPISLHYEDAPAGAKKNPFKVPNPKELLEVARRVAKHEKLQGGVDIVFCSDEKVRELNKAYRKLDKVTDVLSFGWEEEDFAGEIFIAVDQVRYQAPRFNNNYFNELRRVVVHGMLHLCGYDHMKTGERRLMREKEDRYLGISAVNPLRKPENGTKKPRKHPVAALPKAAKTRRK